MSDWARASYRVIALAHKDLSPGPLANEGSEAELHQGLCLDALVAIQDPLRPEVPAAVATCQAAGIMVRMVTGDNLETAVAIARECGILTAGGVAMEGSQFRGMTPAQLDAVLPNLQVRRRRRAASGSSTSGGGSGGGGSGGGGSGGSGSGGGGSGGGGSGGGGSGGGGSGGGGWQWRWW